MSPLEDIRTACREGAGGVKEHPVDLVSDRDVLLDIVARVESLHAPLSICLGCAHPTASSCFETGAPHDLVVVCAACCTHEGRQLSMCVMTHNHTSEPGNRCSTIRAIYDKDVSRHD
ncbi:hypothetical protein [Kocuria rosea]|uniref:hypothetical protein n=1 Tax=Kocuria rosea TaxID=1275 RepID=UPI003D33251D